MSFYFSDNSRYQHSDRITVQEYASLLPKYYRQTLSSDVSAEISEHWNDPSGVCH